MAIRMRVNTNEFGRIADEVRPKVTKAVRATALAVSDGAKRRAPVLTGNLRRSIITRHRDEFASKVGTNVEYARYVEYGTSKMSPRPYLTPALEAERHEFAERVARALRP